MSNLFSELARCQSNLTELSRLLQSLEILQRTQSAPNFTDMQVNYTQIHTLSHIMHVMECSPFLDLYSDEGCTLVVMWKREHHFRRERKRHFKNLKTRV